MTILPPLDCSLNVAQILDFHITHENRTAAYSFTDDDGKITEISRFEFSRAAHRVAHLLRPQRRGLDGQVLAIVALTDVLLYQTIVAGSIIAGLVPFPISHRNSAAAIFHLLSNTGSHRVLTTKGSLGRLVETVATDNAPYEVSTEEIPLLGQVYPHLGHESAEHTFVPISLDNVALYLHSSGSTGFPKSIPETHRILNHLAAMAVGHLPAFHSLGMMTQILIPILSGGTACVYPLASTAKYIIPVVPTAENAIENAQRAKATGIMTSPADVAYLKTLNVVAYAGGPVASAVGDSLFGEGVNIVPIYGATEFGGATTVKRHQAEVDAGEWVWFRFRRRVNVRWEPQGDGTSECQFLTVPETHQLAVENLPDVKGYSTKDLFERHPTKPDLYRIVGRLDDVLIMANGEKTVPGPMEDVMMASPFIKGAVMFGRERNQVGVLIEPNHHYELDPSDEQQLVKYRNLIWPVVEEANKNAPAFARIYKEMILVTQPAKPMVRAPKGTVIKNPTIVLYKQEIEDLYETIEASGKAASDIEPPSSWSPENLEPWLQAHASLVADRDIRGGHDLFDQGFDSLNATFLRHRIVATSAAQKITQNFVYAHPTIEGLANAIAAVVRGRCGEDDCQIQRRLRDALGFPEKNGASSTGQVVLLTGSTGGLEFPVSERQQEAFVDRGLDITLLASEKLIYLEGDTTKEDLGLPLMFGRLYNTVIIHNAWTLDFNKTLSSFEPHVKGTRNLIDSARQSLNARGVRFLFTSSIASAQSWDQNLGPFPEELQLNASVAVGNGYGESKYVSERILAASGLEATSFRIGQITGDWVPALVKSSIALGNFPSDPSGVVAWIPPEAVARPFQLVHPRPVSWDFIISAMAETAQLPLVPFADWVQQLQERSAKATAEDLEKIPGIKLLDFFKAAVAGAGNISFSTSKAQTVSESMRLLEPLSVEDANQWMQYWKEFLA
ncbi:hypothetical protein B0H12DRAFT_1256772 [Mycena haematopus]|nr:hypothetical protein B0H12DRAFT_1256772 [Mycena haematopus]